MKIVRREDGTAYDEETGAELVKTGKCNWRAKGPLFRSDTFVNPDTGEVDTVFVQVEDAPTPPEPV